MPKINIHYPSLDLIFWTIQAIKMGFNWIYVHYLWYHLLSVISMWCYSSTSNETFSGTREARKNLTFWEVWLCFSWISCRKQSDDSLAAANYHSDWMRGCCRTIQWNILNFSILTLFLTIFLFWIPSTINGKPPTPPRVPNFVHGVLITWCHISLVLCYIRKELIRVGVVLHLS